MKSLTIILIFISFSGRAQINVNTKVGALNTFFDEDAFTKLVGKELKNKEVIYGLVNTFTGEQASYTKVSKFSDGSMMNASKVDGVLYKKKGNDYYKLSFTGPINVKWYGATGDGVSDDFRALQSAVTAASLTGNKVYLPEGNYVITKSITTPQAFSQPIIEGSGAHSTKILFSAIGKGLPAIKVKGGSGSLSMGRIQDISFIGNSSSIAIMLADCGGVQVRNCIFEKNQTGILFYNESPNAFTEYCTAEKCDFTSACATAVEYRKSKGTGSFNGSGLLACTINQAESETEPKILINEGCSPYNAPLNFQVWTRSAKASIIRSNSKNNTFYGNITVEPITGVSTFLVDPKGYNVYIVGGLVSNSEKLDFGKAVFCEHVSLLSNGGIAPVLKQHSRVTTVNSGDNMLYSFNLEGSVLQGMSFTITVSFSTNFYNYTYILLCYMNELNSNGSVSILSNPQQFNQAGYGDWKFYISNASLHAVNAKIPKGSNCTLSIMPMGSRLATQASSVK